MDRVADLSSGKGHRDENFPVASLLVKPEHRAPVMAFYRFARAADDVADHPTAPADEKHARLALMREGLSGRTGAPEAVALAAVMDARGLDPVHPHDLLDAFVQDVDQRRYRDWPELIAYCRKSAMPVGRYVLDVHGEDRSLWTANDALCAALQIINHLQDCGSDYRTLDRVYLPQDALKARGASIDALGADAASPALRSTIADLAAQTESLLSGSAGFAGAIRDPRLAAEVAAIQRLAESLAARLRNRDPLARRVHHAKAEAALLAAGPALRQLVRRRRA